MKKSIYDPLGSLTYNTKAIQKIVAMKLAEIDGMLAVDKNIVQRFSNKLTATDYKGIEVEVNDKQVAIDVNAVLEYGRYVPELYNIAMTRVKEEIFRMTGLTLSEFNLNVEDILAIDEYEEIIRKETKENNLLNEKIIENQPKFFVDGKEKTLTEKMKNAVSDLGDTMNEKATEVKEGAQKLMQTAGEKTSEIAENVKEKAIDLGEATKEKAEELGDAIGEKANEAKESAQKLMQTTGEKTSEVAENMKEKASVLGEATKEKAEELGDAIGEKANEAKEGAQKLMQTTGEKTSEVAENVKEKAIDLGEATKEKANEVKKDTQKFMQTTGENISEFVDDTETKVDEAGAKIKEKVNTNEKHVEKKTSKNKPAKVMKKKKNKS